VLLNYFGANIVLKNAIMSGKYSSTIFVHLGSYPPKCLVLLHWLFLIGDLALHSIFQDSPQIQSEIPGKKVSISILFPQH
jgi:hypothetical protein